eukprot:1148957-Rhodomonas_salina.1
MAEFRTPRYGVQRTFASVTRLGSRTDTCSLEVRAEIERIAVLIHDRRQGRRGTAGRQEQSEKCNAKTAHPGSHCCRWGPESSQSVANDAACPLPPKPRDLDKPM